MSVNFKWFAVVVLLAVGIHAASGRYQVTESLTVGGAVKIDRWTGRTWHLSINQDRVQWQEFAP